MALERGCRGLHERPRYQWRRAAKRGSWMLVGCFFVGASSSRTFCIASNHILSPHWTHRSKTTASRLSACAISSCPCFRTHVRFLLQKRVAKYQSRRRAVLGLHRLESHDLAIIVAWPGSSSAPLGKVELKIKPTTAVRLHIIGGLVFGAGFALSGYCPGTARGAGQMNGTLSLSSREWWRAHSFLPKCQDGSCRPSNSGNRGKVLLPESCLAPPRFITAHRLAGRGIGCWNRFE